MRLRIFSFLFFLSSGIFIALGQTSADSLAIVQANWRVTLLQEGIVYKQAKISRLYDVSQDIAILEIDPNLYRFDVVMGKPKTKTSRMAKSTGAVAAINGTFYNVKTGTSVCYLRYDDVLVNATTAVGLWQSGGAVCMTQDKFEILPWNKEIEAAYNENEGTVLGSGPLMLYEGVATDLSSCGRGFVEKKHPRSAIAQTKDGKVLLIAVAGRFRGRAEGMNIPELAHLISVLGGKNALNLDGGGSTTLWAKAGSRNGILNKLCDNKQYDNKGERKVANAVCVYRK